MHTSNDWDNVHGSALPAMFSAVGIDIVAGPDGVKDRSSRAAMEELGRRMEAAQPETIVIMEPHSLLVDGAMSLLDRATVQGESGGPADRGAPSDRCVMGFDVDQELNAAGECAAHRGHHARCVRAGR